MSTEKFLSKSSQSRLTKLGVYQIIGGALGLIILSWIMYKNSVEITFASVVIYFIITLLFSYSIVCGILCIKVHTHCLNLSLTNQLLQLIGLAISGYSFSYIAGVYLTIGIDLNNFLLILNAGFSKLDLIFNPNDERFRINLNIIAFAIIYQISILKKKIKEEAEVLEINSIGNIS